MPDLLPIAQIVALSGGRVVGRTRLQKIAYLLETMNLGWGFDFEYHYYGPFSAELADQIDDAQLLHQINERHDIGYYGVPYSIFTLPTTLERAEDELSEKRRRAIEAMSGYSAMVLEVAATAVYLSSEENDDLWQEVKLRKPQKATDDRIASAKRLLAELSIAV